MTEVINSVDYIKQGDYRSSSENRIIKDTIIKSPNLKYIGVCASESSKTSYITIFQLIGVCYEKRNEIVIENTISSAIFNSLNQIVYFTGFDSNLLNIVDIDGNVVHSKKLILQLPNLALYDTKLVEKDNRYHMVTQYYQQEQYQQEQYHPCVFTINKYDLMTSSSSHILCNHIIYPYSIGERYYARSHRLYVVDDELLIISESNLIICDFSSGEIMNTIHIDHGYTKYIKYLPLNNILLVVSEHIDEQVDEYGYEIDVHTQYIDIYRKIDSVYTHQCTIQDNLDDCVLRFGTFELNKNSFAIVKLFGHIKTHISIYTCISSGEYVEFDLIIGPLFTDAICAGGILVGVKQGVLKVCSRRFGDLDS